MDNASGSRRRELPLKVCPACGGDWFREADYYRFLREETVGPFWPTWPRLVGQLSRGAMTLLVCLCGSPLSPNIGGVRGGHAFNSELTTLLDGLRRVQDRVEDIRTGRSVSAALSSLPASPEMFAALTTRLQNVERALARRMRSGPGRPWRLPKRKPLAKGRDQLVLAVEERAGLTARKAKDVVDKFWKVIARAIRRGEEVEMPIGTLQAVSGPEPQKRVRWGKKQTIYQRPRRIRFRPAMEFSVTNEASESGETAVPETNVRSNELRCEKCGSTHFVEGEFRQYRQQYSSTPGADLVAVSEDPVRALVCLCGHAVPLGKLRRQSISRQEVAEFQKSLEAGRRYGDAAEPEAITRRISADLVSLEQYKRMADQINSLQTILDSRFHDGHSKNL